MSGSGGASGGFLVVLVAMLAVLAVLAWALLPYLAAALTLQLP